MAVVNNDLMTPRETMEHEWRVEEQRILQEHAVTMKRLELETAKLDIKWATWLKIPMAIVKLPVYMIMAFGYVVAMARGKEVPDKFWDYLRT